jgi:hypothetical protein
MISTRIEPADKPIDFIALDSGFTPSTWLEIAISNIDITIGKDYLQKFADPLDAFVNILPLISGEVTFQLPASSESLKSYFSDDWKPLSRWCMVQLGCHKLEIISIALYFTPYVEHCINLPLNCSKRIYIKSDKDKLRKTWKFAIVSAQKIAMTAYTRLMEPQQAIRLAVHEDILRKLRKTKQWRDFFWRDYKSEYNRKDMKWHRHWNIVDRNKNDVVLCVLESFASVPKYLELRSVLQNQFVEGEHYKLYTYPIDRCSSSLAIEGYEKKMWRDNLQWLPGARARLSYATAMLLDMIIGFGVANLFPPYVLLEIFDWDQISDCWTPLEKITIIERIHRRIRDYQNKRFENANKQIKTV